MLGLIVQNKCNGKLKENNLNFSKCHPKLINKFEPKLESLKRRRKRNNQKVNNKKMKLNSSYY